MFLRKILILNIIPDRVVAVQLRDVRWRLLSAQPRKNRKKFLYSGIRLTISSA